MKKWRAFRTTQRTGASLIFGSSIANKREGLLTKRIALSIRTWSQLNLDKNLSQLFRIATTHGTCSVLEALGVFVPLIVTCSILVSVESDVVLLSPTKLRTWPLPLSIDFSSPHTTTHSPTPGARIRRSNQPVLSRSEETRFKQPWME